MNKVILSGNIVKDIELKQTNSGKSVLTNAVAVRREVKNENGEYDADFIDFVAWGQNAEYISRYGHKGDRIEIAGRWQQRAYTDKGGNKRMIDECIVENVTVFSKQEKKQEEKQEAPKFEELDPNQDLPF